MALLLTLLLFAIPLWFLYLKVRNYLHVKDVPLAPGNFFFGHAEYFFNNKKGLFKLTKYNEQYPVYKLYIPPIKPALFMSEPSLMKEVFNSEFNKSNDYNFLKKWLGNGLVVADAKTWKENRRMIQPCFGRLSLMMTFVKVFEEQGSLLVKKLEEEQNNPCINLTSIVRTFTLSTMMETAMGVCQILTEAQVSNYIKSLDVVQKIFYQRTVTFRRSEFLFRFTKEYNEEIKALKILSDISDVIINERIKSNEIKGDKSDKTLLDLLLRKQKETGLSTEHIKHEINTFLFGGVDTTATAIAFTLYALYKNPQIQEKVFDEQVEIFHNFKDLNVTYADLQQMKYLEMVINESLRMYPPVMMIGRKIDSDSFTLADKYYIPRNTSLNVCTYAFHRNSKYFPEPDKFIPERFLEPNKQEAFIAFSVGNRSCIGKKFAILHIKSFISKVIRHFKVLPPTPDEELEIIPNMMLSVKNGIKISLEKRA